MAAGDSLSPSAHRELDRLYWESDRSVNQIADDMGVSKGTLYDLIEQKPSGYACPDCGSELVYPNRTARDRGELSCAECGLEAEEADAERAERPASSAPPGTEQGRQALTRVVAGTALLGLAAGIVVAGVLRRK